MRFISIKIFTLSLFISLSLSLFSQTESVQQKKLYRAYKLLNTQYVDTVDNAAIVEDAIKAMLKNLDPHSKYMSKESVNRSNESIRGSFGGVGIHYQILNDTLIILNTVKSGPSDNAGILAGDKILAIDGETACGKNIKNSFYSKKLRGTIDSEVKVRVLRHHNKKEYDIIVKRGSIPIKTIDAAFMMDRDIAYVKINMFSKSTMKEFNQALVHLQLDGMKHIIIDLRGNPGGLMMASINLANQFLDEGKLIVYTQGEHYKRHEYNANASGSILKGRVVVLIDENSASASEILAGALQDWDRALIMGRRSYGKGLVGRNFILPDGAAIRLTTGRYYTPSGRSIQKSYANGRTAYNNDLNIRYKHGEYIHADSVKLPDSLMYKTNGGRVVYGGGGIIPDQFLPLDTSFYSNYLRQVNKVAGINIFTGNYFNNNLEYLQSKYPDYEAYRVNFNVNESIMLAFRQMMLDKYEIVASEEDWQITNVFIRNSIKSYLARDLFNSSAYFQESSDYDLMILKARQAIKDSKLFRNSGVQAN